MDETRTMKVGAQPRPRPGVDRGLPRRRVDPARLAAVPALLVATAAYAVLAWLRLRRIGQL